MNKLFKILCLGVMSLSLFSCNGGNNDRKTIKITDMANRTVEVYEDSKSFVCLGPGCLRQFTYVGDTSKLVGIEHVDKKGKIGTKPYLKSIKNIDKLPIIGEGGPSNKTNAEQLLMIKPDVVFTSYISDVSKIDELAQRTGLKVIAVGYNSNGLFAEDIYASLKLMSRICGNPERGEEVVNFFESAKNDLGERTKNATTESGYIGCVNFRGSHGLNFTTGDFPAFDALNIKNVAHEKDIFTFNEIDKEALIDLNPDKIIIDAGGLNILKEDMKKQPAYYEAINALKNDEAYMILPTVFYSCNFDVALANAYAIGTYFYPEEFKDINIIEKFDEITSFLINEKCYDDVSNYFGLTYSKLSTIL